jgi:hypothetical protein
MRILIEGCSWAWSKPPTQKKPGPLLLNHVNTRICSKTYKEQIFLARKTCDNFEEYISSTVWMSSESHIS